MPAGIFRLALHYEPVNPQPAGAPLPLHFSPPFVERRAKRRAAKGRTTGGLTGVRRVLVIEDNLDALQTLAVLLKNDGHVVEFAINGYVVAEIAKQFRPDIVLLDLGLPGLDGYEVCRRLKSEPGLEHVPVVAVTAYSDEEHRAKARAAGCDLHIAKPYDPVRLLSIVRDFE